MNKAGASFEEDAGFYLLSRHHRTSGIPAAVLVLLALVAVVERQVKEAIVIGQRHFVEHADWRNHLVHDVRTVDFHRALRRKRSAAISLLRFP